MMQGIRAKRSVYVQDRCRIFLTIVNPQMVGSANPELRNLVGGLKEDTHSKYRDQDPLRKMGQDPLRNINQGFVQLP